MRRLKSASWQLDQVRDRAPLLQLEGVGEEEALEVPCRWRAYQASRLAQSPAPSRGQLGGLRAAVALGDRQRDRPRGGRGGGGSIAAGVDDRRPAISGPTPEEQPARDSRRDQRSRRRLAAARVRTRRRAPSRSLGGIVEASSSSASIAARTARR